MNLSRFQVALNHDDCSVISRGLNDFAEQILSEHGCREVFGYCGHGATPSTASVIMGNAPDQITGLLKSYVLSSPQLEELHFLWNIPGRAENTSLIVAHCHCIAALLYCSFKDKLFAEKVVHRIANDFAINLKEQLKSSSTSVVHHTLSLLIAMCRVSPSACNDIYQRVISLESSFGTLLQKGKTVSWVAREDAEKIVTDSRYLVTLLIFQLFLSGNRDIHTDMMTPKSLLRRMTNGLHNDPPQTLNLILDGLTLLLHRNDIHMHTKINLADASCVQKVIALSNGIDGVAIEAANAFLLSYVNVLEKSLRQKKSSGDVAAVNLLLKHLTPHSNLHHRELQMHLLNARPALLSKCIAQVAIPFDDAAIFTLLCGLTHVSRLLHSTEIDLTVCAKIKACAARDDTNASAEMKKLVDDFIRSMFPSCVSKKELSKLFQHSNVLVQRASLILLLRILQRIGATLGDVLKQVHMVQSHLATTCLAHFPEIQLLFNLRSKYCNRLHDASHDQALYMAQLVLDVIEACYLNVPNVVSQQNMDVTKFLDDIVQWEITDSCAEAATKLSVSSNFDGLVTSTLTILRIATDAGHCRWYGTASDMVKRITNLFVAPSWCVVNKHTPLSKLLLLTTVSATAIRDAAIKLLKATLASCDLFCGHGYCDEILQRELNVWITSVRFPDNSVLLLDILLRIAVHWNAPLCLSASELLSLQGEASVPFSPLVTAALKLLGMNFRGIDEEYPNHIKSHLALAENNFLAKFRENFVPELAQWMKRIILAISVTDSSGGVLIAIGKCFERIVHETQTSSDTSLLNYIADTRELCIGLSQDILSDCRRRTRSNSLSGTNSQPFLILVESLSMKYGTLSDDIDMAETTYSFACAVLVALEYENFSLTWTKQPCYLHFALVKALLRCGSSPSCAGILKFCASHLSNVQVMIADCSADVKYSILRSALSISRDAVHMATGNEKICVAELHSVLATSACIATDCLRYTRCSDAALNSLQVLVTDLTKKDLCGDFARYVCCVAAVLYARRSHTSRKKKNDMFSTSQLWKHVADELKRHAKKHLQQNDAFGLVWVLQDLTNDVALRQMFAKYASEDPELSVIADISSTISSNASWLRALTPLQSSMLLSSSPISQIERKMLLLGIQRLPKKDEMSSQDIAISFVCDFRKDVACVNLLYMMKQCSSLDEVTRVIVSRIVSPSKAIDFETICNQMTLTGSQVTIKSQELIGALCHVLCNNPHVPAIYAHMMSIASMQTNSMEMIESIIAPSLLHVSFTSRNVDSHTLELLRVYSSHCCGVISQEFKSLAEKTLGPRGTVMLRRKVQLLTEEYSSLRLDADLRKTLLSNLLKLIKTLLKFSLAVDSGMKALEELLLASVLKQPNLLLHICSEATLQSDIADFPLHPVLLFEMVIGHSEFSSSLSPAEHTPNLQILRVIVVLLSIIASSFDKFLDAQKENIIKAIAFVQGPLKDKYRGTMTAGDRCILRALFLCYQMENSAMHTQAAWSIYDTAPRGILRKELQRSDSLSHNNQWVLDALLPPVVYTTLAQFPSWRSVHPQPLPFEAPTSRIAYTLYIKAKCRDISAVAGVDGGLYEDDTVLSDTFLVDTSAVYDVAFWLPALHKCLSSGESISIRQLSNCGALSLIVGCVTCPCSTTRMYAYSCLQIILQFLKEQTPDKDVVFRERPQLLLLVSFLKNAINEKPGDGNSDVFRKFPLSSGIFLARAALHLLQPQHELFGKINKYLLSKPFCDMKDVPLYELGIVSGDLHEDGAAVLSTIRFLRDCVRTKHDHLNMCRKNAYSRLMHTFLLMSRDLKIGHAILDIFDRALATRHASRYLIERCDVITWLTQCASIVYVSDENSARDSTTHKHMQVVVNLKLMPRALVLLRRSVGAAWLLAVDGVDAAMITRRCVVAITELVKQTIAVGSMSESPAISVDYIKQLVLCMWDVTYSTVSLVSSAEHEIWRMAELLQLARVCQKVHSDGSHAAARNETMLSILYLIPFCARGSDSQKKELLSLVINLTNFAVLNSAGLHIKVVSEDIQYFALVDGFSDRSAKIDEEVYLTAVNIMAGEAQPLPALQNADEITNFVWEVFSNVDMDAMRLPVHHSCDTFFVIALALKSLRVLICDSMELDFNESYDILRWTVAHTQLLLVSTHNALSTDSYIVCNLHRRLVLLGTTLLNDINACDWICRRHAFFIVCVTLGNWLTSQLRYHGVVPILNDAFASQFDIVLGSKACYEQLPSCTLDQCVGERLYSEKELFSFCTDIMQSVMQLGTYIVSVYDVLKHQDVSAGDEIRSTIRAKAASVAEMTRTMTRNMATRSAPMEVTIDISDLNMPENVQINRYTSYHLSKVRNSDCSLHTAMKAAQRIPLLSRPRDDESQGDRMPRKAVPTASLKRKHEEKASDLEEMPPAKKNMNKKPRGYLWLDRYTNKLMKFRLSKRK